jgi:uncharacterized surface protein with fasciclin (FAS1) repeats
MKLVSSLPFLALASASLDAVRPGDDLDHYEGDLGHSVLSSPQDSQFTLDEILDEELIHSVVGSVSDALGFTTSSDDDDDEPSHTIYELISQCAEASNFTALVNEHKDIVKLLNSTKSPHTVFVPHNDAFAHLPFDNHKPPKDWLRRALEYHIAPEAHTLHDLYKGETLETVLKEDWLGGEAQRLRTSFSLRGFRLNFFTSVTHPNNVRATNGIVHAVDKVLCPPAMVGRELSLVPGMFSTLLLAFEKTDFVKFIHGVKMEGSTVFAPTNRAFTRLGARANAFLFNTDKGKVILKALLKYQIASNVTLYTDAVYRADDGDAADAADDNHRHYDLETLLKGKRIAVDVDRLGPIVTMKVNGGAPVVIRDVPARNGVIQVVGRVPIPPHKDCDRDGSCGDESDGEISVEELVERLWEYVEKEEQVEWSNEL